MSDSLTKDAVIIRDLRIETIVGLYPWERVARQTLLVNLELACDVAKAAETGHLDDTIDYSAVCTAVTQFTQQGEFSLIETLAEDIAALIQRSFSVTGIKVGVYKVDVLTMVDRVGVEITRGKM